MLSVRIGFDVLFGRFVVCYDESAFVVCLSEAIQ